MIDMDAHHTVADMRDSLSKLSVQLFDGILTMLGMQAALPLVTKLQSRIRYLQDFDWAGTPMAVLMQPGDGGRRAKHHRRV